LVLDTKAGVKNGGNGGPILVPGDPKSSRLLKALSYNETDLRMPPSGKLPDEKIAAFEKWIAAGAPDPREDSPAGAPAPVAKKGMDIEIGRKWWAFQPVLPLPEPKVKNKAFARRWTKEKVDWFILAKLEQNKLKPSPEADRATLIERASLDLTGLRPTYEEVQAFVADKSPDAYEKLIDRLLASPHYGERWGRYWLDVARFGEDNPTSEATNPPYPFAWRYRDWVIEAVNKDMPYNQFVRLQLAADLIPDTPRSDLRALGYLGAAPIYHTDLRLSKDVIETLYTDDWDERVDAVGRGLLGLTVGCARCHDHKFDPILSKDYYALAGVFASTYAVPRPTADVDKETEQKFMTASLRLFYLSYLANLMNNEPGSKPEEAATKSARFTKQMEDVRDSMAFLKTSHPEMWSYLNSLAREPRPRKAMPAKPPVADVALQAKPPVPPPAAQRQRRQGASDLPFMQTVFDAGTWIDGSDPDLTMVDIKPGVPRDMHILPHANVAAPGPVVPRQFLTVLSKGDTTFKNGSGRLELANRIFTDAAPLSARVIVNRVWAWHFGKPLVATPSDFGTQGEKPTHPELLDDLAARFMANGWSLKWLHREIMLSATYRQASHPRADGDAVDATNRLLWRMNPRRLDVEAYRDSLLEVTNSLDDKEYGLSQDLDLAENHRRTVYGHVSRGRLNTVLALYDFPDPTMSAPQRDLTTSPLQQLFVMNSPFMQARAADLVKCVDSDPDMASKVRGMYHRALDRDPSPKELDLALSYLDKATLAEYAQALLATNEVIFWP
ncbi:MAG TPA: PSD1 and planctomycete cytochrome C domain-containing protein, partial [Bryobacteraceae bacterium]|nr:PSD1 and planctomycete cytochrome C domain-containing protein [Bryobacteraceae bacterium]